MKTRGLFYKWEQFFLSEGSKWMTVKKQSCNKSKTNETRPLLIYPSCSVFMCKMNYRERREDAVLADFSFNLLILRTLSGTHPKISISSQKVRSGGCYWLVSHQWWLGCIYILTYLFAHSYWLLVFCFILDTFWFYHGISFVSSGPSQKKKSFCQFRSL